MFRRIYLDNSATTPIDPEVLEAMLPFLSSEFGNPSSIHYFGQQARAAVDRARHQVAGLINARPNEIVFTSGGTESNNLAIKGIVEALGAMQGRVHGIRPHIIASAIEHPAVMNVCEDLEKRGCEVTYLPVYDNGIVRTEDLEAALQENTVVVSIMAANNEIGTLQPNAEIGRIVRQVKETGRRIWFHTDAVQAAGKVRVDVAEIGCDLLSISAHKIYGPKGIGALYVRRGTRLHPQNLGGRQERGIRGGTESVANIVAFGRAAEIAYRDWEDVCSRISSLRDRFESKVLEIVPGASVNGDIAHRLPNISNISFESIEGEGLLINLDMNGIAVSTGSACSSGSLEPSPVIRALGRQDDLARGAIRFSLGKGNSDDEIDRVLEILPRSVEALRKLGSSAGIGR